MAQRQRALFARVSRAPTKWVWIGFGCAAVVLFLTPLVIPAVFPGVPPDSLLGLWIYMIYAGVPAVILFFDWYRNHRRLWALAAIARSIGLWFSERLRQRDLEPFDSFVLFRMGETQEQEAAGNCMRGNFDGHEVFLLQYRCQGRIRSFSRRGSWYSPNQTVVILPNAQGLPDFHLSPSDSNRNDRVPGWAELFDAGSPVRLPRSFEEEYELLSHRGEEARELFDRRVRDYFLDSPGWTVEAHRGQLMVFREQEVLDAEECPRLLLKAIDIQEVLCEAEAQRRGEAERAGGPPADGVTEGPAPAPAPRPGEDAFRPDVQE
jgi:hypothetical protein